MLRLQTNSSRSPNLKDSVSLHKNMQLPIDLRPFETFQHAYRLKEFEIEKVAEHPGNLQQDHHW